MAWYLITYLVLFAIVGIGGVVDDLQCRRSRGIVSGSAIAVVIGILCILVFGIESLGHALGDWLWPILGLGVLLEILSNVGDIRDLSRDVETSRTIKIIGILLAIITTVPAYVMGTIAAARLNS
jgi:hypothetical protein